MSLGTILLILIILALVGAIPAWPYNHHWGYIPASTLTTVLIVLLILILLGKV